MHLRHLRLRLTQLLEESLEEVLSGPLAKLLDGFLIGGEWDSAHSLLLLLYTCEASNVAGTSAVSNCLDPPFYPLVWSMVSDKARKDRKWVDELYYE